MDKCNACTKCAAGPPHPLWIKAILGLFSVVGSLLAAVGIAVFAVILGHAFGHGLSSGFIDGITSEKEVRQERRKIPRLQTLIFHIPKKTEVRHVTHT